MNKGDSITAFDWHRIFFSENIPMDYLAEIGLRTVIMFLFLIIALKFLSKRGVKQLSVFELAILIALGSATGDPMFYSYIPVSYGIIVLVVVIFFYRLITRITDRSKKMEAILEGKPICLLLDGRIQYRAYRKVGLPDDKFFAELRLKSISHLGQVKRVYLETSGEMSIYPCADKDVRPGLPIFPELIETPLKSLDAAGEFACVQCGNVQHIETVQDECAVCKNKAWLTAATETRID
jgi:uncharacterized membrane protein YcaP (DUF421 family)